MKNVLYIALVAIVLPLVSCGDDNEEPEMLSVEKKLQRMEVTYTNGELMDMKDVYLFEYDADNRLVKALLMNDKGDFDVAESFVWTGDKIEHTYGDQIYEIQLTEGMISKVELKDQPMVDVYKYDENRRITSVYSTISFSEEDDMSYFSNLDYEWSDGLIRRINESFGSTGDYVNSMQSYLYYDHSVTLPHSFPVLVPTVTASGILTLIHPELFGFNTSCPLTELKKYDSSCSALLTYYTYEYDCDGYVTGCYVRVKNNSRRVKVSFEWR